MRWPNQRTSRGLPDYEASANPLIGFMSANRLTGAYR
jgi:hypothetical protein